MPGARFNASRCAGQLPVGNTFPIASRIYTDSQSNNDCFYGYLNSAGRCEVSCELVKVSVGSCRKHLDICWSSSPGVGSVEL